MAIKYSEKIFDNITTIPTEDKIISIVNAEYLQLVVTGTATSFKLRVYAQANNDEEFLSVAAISDKDFTVSNPIITTGLFKVDVSCFLRIKLVVEDLQGGTLTCSGQVVSIPYKITDSKDNTDTEYVDNKISEIQQDITNQMLIDIELGQQITDLELSQIEIKNLIS